MGIKKTYFNYSYFNTMECQIWPDSELLSHVHQLFREGTELFYGVNFPKWCRWTLQGISYLLPWVVEMS